MDSRDSNDFVLNELNDYHLHMMRTIFWWTNQFIVDLLPDTDTALWIMKDFCGTIYYIVIIFQRIQYLI
jgi:hypothetical protein